MYLEKLHFGTIEVFTTCFYKYEFRIFNKLKKNVKIRNSFVLKKCVEHFNNYIFVCTGKKI